MIERKRHAVPRTRRKKRGTKLIIAYALQSLIFLLLALMIVLIICEALYIKEHLFPVPDNEPSAAVDVFRERAHYNKIIRTTNYKSVVRIRLDHVLQSCVSTASVRQMNFTRPSMSALMPEKEL